MTLPLHNLIYVPVSIDASIRRTRPDAKYLPLVKFSL